jgi:DNA adenine methylase
MPQADTLIRWAGGKSWFVSHFKKYTDGLEYNNYIEPFFGGGSIFFSAVEGHQAFLSDVNEELILMYQVARDHPEELADVFSSFVNSEQEYYRIRSWLPSSDIEKAARFLYLNHTSYNGIYRVNRAGVYNVPYGFRNMKCDKDRILAASKKLQNAVLSSGDFETFRDKINPNDLVFLDPPYSVSRKSGENGFIAYNAKLFSLDEQYRLSRFVDHIKACGAYYMVTNSAHDTIAEIFEKGDRRIDLQRGCSIGGKNAARGQVKEYLFTNIPERKDATADDNMDQITCW